MPFIEEEITEHSYGGDWRGVGVAAYPKLNRATRSGDDYQVMSYFTPDGELGLAVRNATQQESWTEHVQPNITTRGPDPHHTACVGIDPSGVLHVCYDMHNDPLLYRRSDQPIESFGGSLTAEQDMLGTNESSVTYPRFFNDPNGELYVIFRDGGSGDGDWYFYHWDNGSSAWEAATGTGIDGLLINGKTTGVNPYGSMPPFFDSDFGNGGYMHFFWNWRDTAGGLGPNHDVLYARWDGTSFEQSDGTSQTVPITENNAETAVSISTNSGLSNLQTPAWADASDNPMCHYGREDGNGDTQMWLVWHNGTSWTETQITSHTGKDYSVRGGTMSLYGDLVVNQSDNSAFLFYRLGNDIRYFKHAATGDFTGSWTDGGVIYTSDAPLVESSDNRDSDMRPTQHDRDRWTNDRVWEIPLARGIERRT